MKIKSVIDLRFYLPGLFQPLGLWCKDFAFQPAASHLLRLCANTSVSAAPVRGLEATLFHDYGKVTDGEIPFAYHRYCLDFGVPPPTALLCADPVCLKSGLDSVVMQPELPSLTLDEVTRLLAVLNQHLQEDGLQLVAKHPQRWYLLGERVQADATLRTVPLSQALGQSIFALLPQGDKRYWHRLLNEIQMLLHSCESSATNALWLWGAANPAASVSLPANDFGGCIGTSLTSQVLALASNTPHQAVTTLSEAKLETGNSYALVLDALHVPSVSDEMQSWQQALNALDEHWFAPAFAGLQSGRFAVSLTACDGRTWHCKPTPAWRFWQTRCATWKQFR